MKLLDSAAGFLTKKSHVFLAALVLSLPLLAAALFYLYQVTASMESQKAEELKSIAKLKIDQLVEWRKERTFDANVIRSSVMIPQDAGEFIRSRSPAAAARLKRRILTLFSNSHYDLVFFSDTTGKAVLGLPETPSFVDPFLQKLIAKITRTGEIIHSDFYFCEGHNSIHYDVLTPLTGSKGRVIAVMVFRVDPGRYLFPYIQQWPGSSKSSETLLIRPEGDSIVFLNELRHIKNTALRLRVSLRQRDVVAVKAVLGDTGYSQSKDYRGAQVLSYTANVPGTPWFLIAKIDKDEVFSDIYSLSWLAAGFVAFMLLAVVLGLLWLYHLNQRNFYKKNWEKEQTYKTVLRSIDDAVITTDKDGKINYLNPAAEKLTGWPLHEALHQPVDKIFYILDEETLEKKPAPVSSVLKNVKPETLAGNILLQTHHSLLTPIADSCAPILDENGNIAGSVLVFRDQTAERLQAKIFRSHLNLLSFASENNHHAVLVKALDELELLTGSTIGFLHFVEADQENILLQAWSTRTSREYCKAEGEGLHYNISKAGIWTECIHTKTPVIHNNYETAPNKKGLPEGHAALIRELVIPVVRNEKVVAIVGVGNKPAEYTNTDAEIASYLADIIWEITEKRRIQDENSERDRRFAALFSSMNEGVALHELLFDETGAPYDYKIIAVNQAYEKQTGIRAEDVINKPSRQAYNTPDPPYFDIYKETALSGTPHIFETYYPPLDKYFLISVFQTGPHRFGTSFQDLTQLKKADIAFRESARAFNSMIENLSGVVYRCKNDHNWTMEYISDGIEELSGYPKSDFVNNAVRTYNSLIHPDDQQMVWERIQSAIEVKTPYVLEYRVLNIFNEVKWVWERGRGVYNSNNELIALEGFITDITQIKIAENEIKHSSRLYAMLSQTNKAVVRLLDHETLFNEICRTAVDSGKFTFAWIGEFDEAGKKLTPVHYQGAGAEVILKKLETATAEEFERRPCVLAARENRIVVQNNLHTMFDQSFIDQNPVMQQFGSFAATPIQQGGHTRFILAVYASEINFFRQKEINLLEEIGLDITFAIANYEKELQRKEAERIISESERKYSDLYENSPDMFLSVNPKTAKILECNLTTCNPDRIYKRGTDRQAGE